MNKPVGHFGGKSNSVSKLLKYIPYHNKYIEIFGGGASLLFAKVKSYKEVYNDIDGLLVNFFLTLRDNHQAFFKLLNNTPVSYQLFKEYCGHWEQGMLVLPESIKALTGPEQAVIYYLVKRNSYGNKMCEFDAANRTGSVYRPTARQVLEFRNRLRDVVIENRSFEEIIKRYDKWDTFFYCDPPYYKEGGEKRYGVAWDKSTHLKLFRLLNSCKSKWMLSYGDNSFIKDLYKEYTIRKLEVHFTVTFAENNIDNKKVTDLIITNY